MRRKSLCIIKQMYSNKFHLQKKEFYSPKIQKTIYATYTKTKEKIIQHIKIPLKLLVFLIIVIYFKKTKCHF